jgi:integrase
MKKSTDIRTLKNLNSPIRYSIPDSRGLHLWVRKDTKKYWIYRYTFDGKRFDMSLGCFPEISLAFARIRHQKLRALLLQGVNPSDEKRIQREEKSQQKRSVRFSKFAFDYIDRMSPKWTNRAHEAQWSSSIRNYAIDIIGNLTLEEITTDDILEVLTPIWATKNETAIRLRGRLERIFSASITSGLRTKPNPAFWKGHLENLLPAIKRTHKHFEAASYKELPILMERLSQIRGVSALALQFTILNASRSGEVLYAKRDEVSDNIWTIPAERMKARSEHQVPLGPTALSLIEKARALDPESDYLFSRNGKHLSVMSMLMKTRRLKRGLTVHGFRSTFRDWVSEETDHSPEVAEMALAHTIANKVEAAYRRGKLLERRRVLLADWESYCLSAINSKASEAECTRKLDLKHQEHPIGLQINSLGALHSID